jgi:type III secretion protein J
MTDYFIRRVLITGILLFGVAFAGGCSDAKVQTVAEEVEANEILDVLREHKISAYKMEGGEGVNRYFEIYVNGGEEEYGAAIQLMDDHCLPQALPPKVEASGIVSSIEVEKAQQLRRTKINIESQLRKIPGTTCVDVTIVPPEDRSLSLNPYKSTATVLVKHKNEKYDLNVNQIGRMVAGGVPGLNPENVTVTLTRQPLRPVPDLDRGRNIRRLLYVSGIGLTTILIFVGIVVFLRKRNSRPPDEADELEFGPQTDEYIEDGEPDDETPPLDGGEEK